MDKVQLTTNTQGVVVDVPGVGEHITVVQVHVIRDTGIAVVI